MKIIKTSNYKMAERIDNNLRQKINADLSARGLDGNGRFPESDSGVSVIWEVLDGYGLVIGEVVSKNSFMGSNGRRSLGIQRKGANPQDPFTPGEDIDNSAVAYTWYEREPDNFEILAYLS
jgi:hypothetical protein